MGNATKEFVLRPMDYATARRAGTNIVECVLRANNLKSMPRGKAARQVIKEQIKERLEEQGIYELLFTKEAEAWL